MKIREAAPDAELQKGQRNDFQLTLKEIDKNEDEVNYHFLLRTNASVIQTLIKRSDEVEGDGAEEDTKKKSKSREDRNFDRIPTCPEEECLFYFKKLTYEWGQDLENRPESVKRSVAGKNVGKNDIE